MTSLRRPATLSTALPAPPAPTTQNILLTRDLSSAKIADVGWAQILYHSYITGDGGTFNWAVRLAAAEVYCRIMGVCWGAMTPLPLEAVRICGWAARC